MQEMVHMYTQHMWTTYNEWSKWENKHDNHCHSQRYKPPQEAKQPPQAPTSPVCQVKQQVNNDKNHLNKQTLQIKVTHKNVPVTRQCTIDKQTTLYVMGERCSALISGLWAVELEETHCYDSNDVWVGRWSRQGPCTGIGASSWAALQTRELPICGDPEWDERQVCHVLSVVCVTVALDL